MEPASRVVLALAVAIASLCMSGCSLIAQKQQMDVSSPAFAQYAVTPPIDRKACGLMQPPRAGNVIIETLNGLDAKRAGYDVMLHYSRPDFTKTIALRKNGQRWIWLGEQDGHTGPREYDSVDGRFRERLFVSCNMVSRFGAPKGSRVDYFGDDDKLRGHLTTAGVEGVLRAWRLESATEGN